jgi:acetate kinase
MGWDSSEPNSEKTKRANERVISDAAVRVAVRVIRKDEAGMIAKTVCRVIGLKDGNGLCHEYEEY